MFEYATIRNMWFNYILMGQSCEMLSSMTCPFCGFGVRDLSWDYSRFVSLKQFVAEKREAYVNIIFGTT